ncbi:MAG: anti-sigma factor [Anaerolineae bacterium]|nr:anti-sigma factor [Thermoflexales bacterium]MDW8408307.1 anti-sigma factor [Anaerolineae bacterium]
MTQEEKIALYALGALEADEAEALRRELADSPELQELLARDRVVATLILASVEPVQPSPDLKQRLMEQINDSWAAESVIDSSASEPAMSTGSAGAAVLSPRRILRKARTEGFTPSFTRLRDERPRRTWPVWVLSGLSMAATVVALAVAIVLAIRLGQSETEASALRQQVAQLHIEAGAIQKSRDEATARILQLERDLTQLRSTLAQAQQALDRSRAESQQLGEDIAALRAVVAEKEAALTQAQTELSVLLQPNVRVAVLPGVAGTFRNATVTVFYAPQSTTAYLSVTNLPSLPPDQTYQVWLINRNQRLPSTVFNTDASGTSRLIVQSAQPFSAFQNIGVTVEPAGGSQTPNPAGPIVLGRL